MIYPELAALDVTADQDLGLAIAFKSDSQTTATTPGAYLALRVQNLLDTYATQYVDAPQAQRILSAVKTADAKTLADVATALKIDLTVAIPADVKP